MLSCNDKIHSHPLTLYISHQWMSFFYVDSVALRLLNFLSGNRLDSFFLHRNNQSVCFFQAIFQAFACARFFFACLLKASASTQTSTHFLSLLLTIHGVYFMNTEPKQQQQQKCSIMNQNDVRTRTYGRYCCCWFECGATQYIYMKKACGAILFRN